MQLSIPHAGGRGLYPPNFLDSLILSIAGNAANMSAFEVTTPRAGTMTVRGRYIKSGT